MKNKKSRYLLTILIVFICVISIAFFVLPYRQSLSENADSPDDIPDTQNNAAATSTPPAPTPVPVPVMPPVPAAPGIEAYRLRLTGDEYKTFMLDEEDISNGNLVLVNNDTYYEIPGNLGLVSISAARSSSYRVKDTTYRVRSSIMTDLNNMMDAFKEETGREYMYIISAYRDYNTQKRVYDQYINEPGRAARVGYSEHHTGLAIDFAVFIGGVEYSFINYAAAMRWYSANSYKYGFILRYPEHKTSITKVISEPWHYRYIGIPHSYIMYSRGWVLEEYIEKIKDYTLDEPYTVEFQGKQYEVYYSGNTSITVPVHAAYDISGNNTDGFIVTIYDRYDRLTNVSAE